MFDSGYPAHMTALAARVDDLAAQVAARQHRLAALTDTGEWDGPAARAFRHHAHGLSATLRHAVTALDHAADALRRHGHSVHLAFDGDGHGDGDGGR